MTEKRPDLVLEKWICLLCKSSRPGYHGTLDDHVTPCPNGAPVPRMDAWESPSQAPAPVQELDYAAVLADLQRVCKHHGVALIGTCYAEGIFGEIEIARASAVEFKPRDPDQLQKIGDDVFVTAIGIPT